MADDVTLVDYLAARSPEQLATILRNRPDVRWGAPLTGLSDLADRLSDQESVNRALQGLSLPQFQVLQALLISGPRATPERVPALLVSADRSANEQAAAVGTILDELQECALIWPEHDGGLAIEPWIRQSILRPLGLGMTVRMHLSHSRPEEVAAICTAWGIPVKGRPTQRQQRQLEARLTDRDAVHALLTQAPTPIRRHLQELALAQARQDPDGAAASREQVEGENWARRRGLLFGGRSHGYYYAPREVPAEVILTMLDLKEPAPFDPEPPTGLTRTVAPETLRTGAAAAAAEFTQSVAALVDRLTRTPAAGLKAGGIGSRELAKIGKALDLDETRVRFGVELLRDLGLLAGSGGAVGAAPAAGQWRSSAPSSRYADLAVVWWQLPVHPTVGRDVDDKAIPAAGRRTTRFHAETLRFPALSTVAVLPQGEGMTDPEALGAALFWRAPHTPLGRSDIAAFWQEAHDLGVLVDGAITPVGRKLLAGDPDGLLAVAEDLLAPATATGRFGSDLTVMVAGSPTAAVSTLLDTCADREGRGAAVVWRFSPGSVRRAFDEGWTADRLTVALRDMADTDLPQPLTYLIADTQRRHGHLVVLPAASCVRSRDPALLQEVIAHRSLQKLCPHLVTEQVAVFQHRPAMVVATLQAAGYLPVLAGEDGVVDLRRTAPPHQPNDAEEALGAVHRLREQRVQALEPEQQTVAAAGELLRTGNDDAAGDDLLLTGVEAEIAGWTMHLTELERRQLAWAIERDRPVSIAYQSATGGRTVRIVSDLEVIGELLYGWCHLREDERVFNLSRIWGVTPVVASRS
jgi:hypothetical protein